jgi:energy-converting hydrogenase Eha subunit E
MNGVAMRLIEPIAKSAASGHMVGMEQEIRRPDYVPRKHDRAASSLNCALAAIGVTLMTLCLVGAAALTTVWAVSKLLGVSDTTMMVLAGLVSIPVIALSIWTAGRAWHLEQRLARGLDVDTPVFNMLHYFRKTA